MVKKITIVLLFALVFTGCSRFSEENQEQDSLKDFIAEQDLIINPLTPNWHEGAFTGNGLLGTMVYLDEDSSGIRIDIGRTDVVDHRPEFGLQYGQFRLPIGKFVIVSRQKPVAANARMNLYDAIVEGNIETPDNNLDFKILTHTHHDVIIVELNAETGFQFDFKPAISVSPRYYRQNKWSGFAPEGYKPNPSPVLSEENGIHYCYQPLLAGGSYTTAWKKVSENGKTRFYISVGNSFPQDISKREARNNILSASSLSFRELLESHTKWWHDFYTKSFVNLPDKQFEQFWWIQQYKMGSATRADCPAIDLMGPWFRSTPWASYWFNLNVQLTYWPMYSCNRLDLAESLINFINNNKQQLIKNAPEKFQHNSAALGRNSSFDMACPINLENPKLFPRGEPDSELGNLTWLLHNYWLHCRYSKDDSLLVNHLYPLLKRSINFYINIMETDDQNVIHLPKTYSPEYPGGFTRDCNYDLALFMWGCQTLLDISEEHQINDSIAPTWKKVLNNLTAYPTNENGLMIGRDVPFEESHRHFSHLMMWYPLHNMESTEENKNLILKSIEHWHSFEKALQGYSFTGGACMYAQMGNGNKAYSLLKTFMNDFMRPNTMYLEAGPVIETPLSAVTSINDMLLQSGGDTLRIFPAIPDEWSDITFNNLRAEGAFLVSAEMKNGKMEHITIKSLVGGKCILINDFALEKMSINGIPEKRIKINRTNLLIEMKADETITFEVIKAQL